MTRLKIVVGAIGVFAVYGVGTLLFGWKFSFHEVRLIICGLFAYGIWVYVEEHIQRSDERLDSIEKRLDSLERTRN